MGDNPPYPPFNRRGGFRNSFFNRRGGFELAFSNSRGGILSLFFLFFLLTGKVDAQGTEELPVVYAIRIIGNDVTNEKFILREMELKPGSTASPDKLESDRLHLLSLGIFNQVELTIITDQGRAIILVRVTERFYIYPYPILRYDPIRPSRRVFGLTINHYNFRGYAERLSAGWWDGYERGAFIQHRDPWFSLGGLYGLQTHAFLNNIEIISNGVPYRAKIESILMRVRRRLTRERWIGLEAEWEERSSNGEFYTLSADGRDRLLVARLYYESDQRDYIYYPREGYFFTAIAKANRMVDTTHSFYREQADLRLYFSFGSVTYAFRGTGQLTQKKVPFYRKAELTQFDIRSDSPVGLLGSQSRSASAELRFNILPLRHYSFDRVPYAGKYLQELKFSIEGLFFVDTGTLRIPEISRDKYFSAYGLGLQFQLPYIEVAHITLGWGPDNAFDNPVIIAATGVTF